MGGVRYHSL